MGVVESMVFGVSPIEDLNSRKRIPQAFLPVYVLTKLHEICRDLFLHRQPKKDGRLRNGWEEGRQVSRNYHDLGDAVDWEAERYEGFLRSGVEACGDGVGLGVCGEGQGEWVGRIGGFV